MTLIRPLSWTHRLLDYLLMVFKEFLLFRVLDRSFLLLSPFTSFARVAAQRP